MVKTRRNGRKKCGGKSRKPKFNMKGCASKRRGLSGGNPYPIAPLSWAEMQKMKGGSCPNCYRSILGISQTGGCGTCSMSGGGSFYKTDLAPVPAPFVGAPWGPRVSEWPGVDGVDSGRNFFANNLYNHGDPQTSMKLYSGGTKSKSRRRHQMSKCKGGCGPKCSCKGCYKAKCNCTPKCQCGCNKKVLKGGAFLPDFVGLGRDLSYNFKGMYNSLNGFPEPVNPKPYVQPALSSSNPM
jgi:hypothetical protein